MFWIYISPSAILARLKEKPAWLLPLFLAVAANLAATAVTTQYMDWQEQKDTALEQMRQRGMSEEQIEKAQEGMDRFYSSAVARNVVPLVTVLVNQLLSVFLLSLVVSLIAHLHNAQTSYLHALSVVTHAHLITLPAAALRILLALLTRSSTVTTSLWAAFPDAKGGAMALLTRLDPFIIWGYFLLGVGLSVVFGLKRSRGLAFAFGIWALFTVLSAIPGLVSNHG